MREVTTTTTGHGNHLGDGAGVLRVHPVSLQLVQLERPSILCTVVAGGVYSHLHIKLTMEKRPPVSAELVAER